jgi:7-keto-8-aminopelargonate synthetase-like enzyme
MEVTRLDKERVYELKESKVKDLMSLSKFRRLTTHGMKWIRMAAAGESLQNVLLLSATLILRLKGTIYLIPLIIKVGTKSQIARAAYEKVNCLANTIRSPTLGKNLAFIRGSLNTDN